jgi:hypothetical protein
MYRNGLGVPADPERAILGFSMGANLGDKYAQYNLACSYMNGEWVMRNYTLAARWHEQSALRGNTDSQYFLGCLYADGLGVPRDPGRAREWLTQAERGGHAEAGALLETLYELEDDQPLPRKFPSEPARVDAENLLREFSHTPIPGVDRGRVVLLDIGTNVEVAPSEESNAFFLTVPGSPGVIYLYMKQDAEAPSPGSTVRGVGTGPSGLSGFIRMNEVENAGPLDGEPEGEAEPPAESRPEADAGTGE